MKDWEIKEQFGFKSCADIDEWVIKEPSFIFNDDCTKCLYTDGFSGLAVISISEVFNDAGIDIELVDCMYCGFNYFELRDIFDALVDAFNNWSEE